MCIYLVSLFSWYITVHGLFHAKAILAEGMKWCYLTPGWEDNGVYTFSKSESKCNRVIGVRTRLLRCCSPAR